MKLERISQEGSKNNKFHITITVAFRLHVKLSPRPGEIQFLVRKDLSVLVVLCLSYKRIKRNKKMQRIP